MFGFGKKQDMTSLDVKSVDLSKSNDFQTFTPRYEYTVKIFEEDADGKILTSIQKGIHANSDRALFDMYALCQQKIQILEKREINPNAIDPEEGVQQTQISSMPVNQLSPSVLPTRALKPEPTVKYFSAGGLDFKMVDNEVFQKQWIRATEEESAGIRIVSDTTNKIMPLKDKHLEIQHWIKVEDSTDLE